MARYLVLTILLATPGCADRGADEVGETSETESSSDTDTSETESSSDSDPSETEDTTEDGSTEVGPDLPVDPVCGDGQVEGEEACDDNNLADFDGCTAACAIEHEILELAVGDYHNCIRTVAGVKCWGGWFGGQLGQPAGETIGDDPGEMGAALAYVDVGGLVTELSAGSGTVCSGVEGGVKCWGWNEHAELGLGDTENRGDMRGEMGGALPYVDLADVAVGVYAGQWGSCAILRGGLKCWGQNGFGWLGQGDTEIRGDEPGEMGDALPFVELAMGTVTTVVTQDHRACALDDLGRVKCWGLNAGGQLGLGDMENRGDEPGEMGDALPFVDLGVDAQAVVLARGQATQCVVLSDARLKCWGQTGWIDGSLWPGSPNVTGDELGEMGDTLIDLAQGVPVQGVAVGPAAVCVLFEDGAVRCVGSNNDEGMLGQGHAEPIVGTWLANVPDIELGEPAIHIAAGERHMCAVLESGNLKCWGRNDGVLGLEDDENRGDQPGEMGEALPYLQLF